MTTHTAQNTIAFDQISEPGTYVCNWNGHLLQIPINCFVGNVLSCTISADEPLFVTKISDNPQVNVNEARELAFNCERVSF